MKLRRTLIAAATVSVALLAGAGVAVAQDQQDPSCAEAISVYVDARADLDKLPKTIENPELPGLTKKVEDAQSVVTTRESKLTEAMKGVVDNGGALGTGPSAGTLGAELDRLQAFKAPRAADVEARISAVKTARQAEADLRSAQATLENATKARKGAPNRIDNPALKSGPVFDAMVKAQTAADKACEGQPNDPGPIDPPNNGGNDDNGSVDNGGSNNGSVDDGLNPGPITSTNGETVTVPSGGVETGGGPA